jgi:hypothetical protein
MNEKKRLGYMSEADATRVLSLLEKNQLEASLHFDSEFAELYKKSFPIHPPLRRRSSYRLPEMGWFLEYDEAQEKAVQDILRDSSWAFLLQEPVEEDPFDTDEKSAPQPRTPPDSSRRKVTLPWVVLVMILGLIAMSYIVRLLHQR